MGSKDNEGQLTVKHLLTLGLSPGHIQAEKAQNYLNTRTILASDINIAYLDMKMLCDKFELVVHGESVFPKIIRPTGPLNAGQG